MKDKQRLLVLGVVLSATTFKANASLTSYTANGVDFVSMQGGGFDVSFTKDGNLFKTLASSYIGGASAFVNAVIASVPGGKINDTPNYYDTPSNSGYHTLSSNDFYFSATGLVNWFGAQAFIGYLNSISYGGSSEWQLPKVTDTGKAGCDYAYSGTDCGYNVDTSTNALAQLYYGELNKTAYLNTNGLGPQGGYGIFDNNGDQIPGGAVDPFVNVQSYVYWSGSEYSTYSGSGWNFNLSNGEQFGTSKGTEFYVWAISPGQVAVVSVPSAFWLFGTGVLGFLRLKRRDQCAIQRN
jgi:hypothetical protein